MAVTPEFIEYLYEVPKQTTRQLTWVFAQKEYLRATFVVPLVSEEGHEMVWRGWYQCRRGVCRHGFKILYAGRYDVRSWDMAYRHKDFRTSARVRGTGCHKHRYRSELFRHDTYEIPVGEISIDDPNQAVLDFAVECSISLDAGYQVALFF